MNILKFDGFMKSHQSVLPVIPAPVPDRSPGRAPNIRYMVMDAAFRRRDDGRDVSVDLKLQQPSVKAAVLQWQLQGRLQADMGYQIPVPRIYIRLGIQASLLQKIAEILIPQLKLGRIVQADAVGRIADDESIFKF